MKKLIGLFFVSMMCLGNFNTIKADNSDYHEALEKAQRHIDNGGIKWNGAEIVASEKLYDINMEEYGYVFEVDNSEDEGYIIVVQDINGNYYMNEASPNGVSPYKNLEDEVNVYYSAMNYYATDNISTFSDEIVFTDLTSGEEYNYSEFKPFEREERVFPVKTRNTRDTRVWLPDYFTDAFELIDQKDSYSCIPTSTAMAVKYLHNMGFLTLDGSMRDLETIKYELIDLMNSEVDGRTTHTNAINGIKEFGNSYSSEPLAFGSDFNASTSAYNTLTTEIDDGYPAIIMYEEGVLPRIDDVHANTLVGYDDYEGTVLSYDPINERDYEVAWTVSNIYGQYVIYVG